MATTLIAQYQAATGDKTFIQKVEMAMLQTAHNLKTEASGTANHANRMALMKAVTNDPDSWAPRFALVIASQAIDSVSTDAAIQTACANAWDALAGQV